jgi:hypothetical protein
LGVGNTKDKRTGDDFKEMEERKKLSFGRSEYECKQLVKKALAVRFTKPKEEVSVFKSPKPKKKTEKGRSPGRKENLSPEKIQ